MTARSVCRMLLSLCLLLLPNRVDSQKLFKPEYCAIELHQGKMKRSRLRAGKIKYHGRWYFFCSIYHRRLFMDNPAYWSKAKVKP